MSNKTFICNGGMGFTLIWKGISMLMAENTKKKCVVMKKNVWSELVDHFGKNNIEKRYGGDLDNAREIGSTWPPVSAISDPVSLEQLKDKGRTIFYLISEEEDDVLFSQNLWEEKEILEEKTEEVFEEVVEKIEEKVEPVKTEEIAHEKNQESGNYEYYFWRVFGVIAFPTVLYSSILVVSMLKEHYYG